MLTRAFARSSFDISMRREPTSKDESENDTIQRITWSQLLSMLQEEGVHFSKFMGSDYPTPDGTCIPTSSTLPISPMRMRAVSII